MKKTNIAENLEIYWIRLYFLILLLKISAIPDRILKKENFENAKFAYFYGLLLSFPKVKTIKFQK